jgi:hypothetical protein
MLSVHMLAVCLLVGRRREVLMMNPSVVESLAGNESWTFGERQVILLEAVVCKKASLAVEMAGNLGSWLAQKSFQASSDPVACGW